MIPDTPSSAASGMGEYELASASVRPEPTKVVAGGVQALPNIAHAIEAWLFDGADDAATAKVILELVAPDAMRLARHLRVAQVIYDDDPDESDKAQADLHMSAAILLAKRIVPYGDTRVSDADTNDVINSAPRAHLTGGRNV